jgi:single-stranded-DNA-specific exonuclease
MARTLGNAGTGVAADSDAAVLGVERSVCGRRWRARGGDAMAGLALAQRFSLPEIVGRLLAARGIEADAVESFLAPTLRALLPDPSDLTDMDKGAERLARAVTSGERIAVFGDYDVDGATSSALLSRFFRAVGADITIYIPDRMKEGYGPNAPALMRLRAQGIAVAVTVDCGISAFEALEAAQGVGLDVVVVDHHEAEPRLPPAVAVIDANRVDEAPAVRERFGRLAAVGVAFLLAVAVNRALRAAGWYRNGRVEPDLLRWLDLVALGTVCDVVSLTGLNRALVAQGLKVLARRESPGLAALADVARLDERPSAWHLGFILGPRVNAGGRVGEADLGSRLLSTDDPVEAARLAARLDALNKERKEIEQGVLDAAIMTVESRGEAGSAEPHDPVFVAGEGWHPGVIGIVASRLKERYHRPALVVALDGPVGKGSGRSVAGIDLGAVVIAARQAGLLVNGGGHAMAAGLTVDTQRLAELRDFIAARLRPQIADGALIPSLSIDGAVNAGAATPALMAEIDRLGPFGTGNPEPRFALPAVRIAKADVVGDAHVRCFIAGADGARLKAIAFRALEGPLGPVLLQSGGAPLHLAGHLRPDTWQGRNEVQLLIDDAALAAN